MKLKGKRVQRRRLIEKGNYVVAVDVELVIPKEDPGEPCMESETVELLRQVEIHAEEGDVKWLSNVGKVYALVSP